MPSRERRLARVFAALFTLSVMLIISLIAFSRVSSRTLLALPAAHALAGDTTFYGIKFEGDAFVWCIDRSGSMGWSGEIDVLKQQTVQAISELSSGHRFSVVAFGTTSLVWSNLPRRAFTGNKLSANAWVNALTASGWTCMESALLASLNILALATVPEKAILLLADGSPICNGVDTSGAVLGNVTAANTQNVAIHTIYVGADAAGISFMQQLATLNNGTFAIGQPSPTLPMFFRGDADGDALVNGLADAVFLLNYQFVPGSPAPRCLDAADADDDGAVSGIIDGLFLLSWEFIPGSPAPPRPEAFTCGLDPTSDGIGCVSHPCF